VPAARPLFVAAVLAALVAPGVAHARDPGRWVRSADTQTRLEYFQGITHDRTGRLYFSGVTFGGYRTDLALREQARNPDLIPEEEPFNHVGDWTYDGAEGGRLILPLECYTPNAPNGGNTCGVGALGVADPNTLAWRYRVMLDQADIAKAMWAEVSPDGRLIWTSSGPDLLAYAAADVNPANAAAGPIRPVSRLAGAVPPSGVTGAVFDRGRLLLAGQATGPFQVWSVDVATGARRLEIEQRWRGESEGLDVVDALGGELQWQVMPFDPQGRLPTFPFGRATIVSFVRRADAALRVGVRPVRLRAGRTARVVATVRQRYAGRDHPVAGARVALAGRRATTDRRGRATVRVRPRRAGRLRVVATKGSLRAGRRTLKVAR
jgi:hypothetical protein